MTVAAAVVLAVMDTTAGMLTKTASTVTSTATSRRLDPFLPLQATVACTATAVATYATTSLRKKGAFTSPVMPLQRRNFVSFEDLNEDDDWENEDDADDDDDEDWAAPSVNRFLELQRHTGSEILNQDLQQQIDHASSFAAAGKQMQLGQQQRFMNAHEPDASWMEQVAMSSIPEQLPRPAVEALTAKNNYKRSPTTTSRKTATAPSDLNFSHARVTPEQEVELGRRIQRGVALHKLKTDFEQRNGREISKAEWATLAGLDSITTLRRCVAQYRRAKQALVTANIGLVHAVVKTTFASTFKHSKSGCEKEEWIQEGSLGLMRAAELFDPSRGLRFSTYATIWIKGVLSNSHLVESIKLPLREKAKWNKIVKAYQELSLEHNQEHASAAEPTIEEVAAYLNMKVSDVLETKRRMNQATRVLSLDYEYKTQSRSGSDESTSRENSSMLKDRAFMADSDLAERTQMQADLLAALTSNLNAREARLMRLRYGLADGRVRSIAECADAMGLSQTRVQQLAQDCLKKLRRAAEMESLEEYLLTIA